MSAVIDYDEDNMKTLVDTHWEYLHVIMKSMGDFRENKHLVFTGRKIIRQSLIWENENSENPHNVDFRK